MENYTNQVNRISYKSLLSKHSNILGILKQKRDILRYIETGKLFSFKTTCITNMN